MRGFNSQLYVFAFVEHKRIIIQLHIKISLFLPDYDWQKNIANQGRKLSWRWPSCWCYNPAPRSWVKGGCRCCCTAHSGRPRSLSWPVQRLGLFPCQSQSSLSTNTKSSAYCTKSIMYMLCLTFNECNWVLIVPVIQININVFLQSSNQ